MRPTRSILLLVSTAIVLFLVGGGLAVRVGAGENSYRQAVLFSEILSLVVDNYVDPVEADKLLDGAYEGMLSGLDANGAFLSPEEVKEWKTQSKGELAHPGVSVLKGGRALQVVAVDPGSPAEEAGIEIGDQIRAVDGRPVRDLSLSQGWRLILGPPGTRVRLDLFHPSEGFRREEIEVARERGYSRAYDLDVERGLAVLTIRDMSRLPVAEVASELEDVASRGVGRLLVDVRNLADLVPRQVAAAGGLFASGTLLKLRDRAGRLVESVESPQQEPTWSGHVAVLVNGATAGSAEALASVIQAQVGGMVLGESSYGLGAEARLYELEDGSGLVVSSALWETTSGQGWNGEGVEPDEVIHGRGDDFESMASDQLDRALEWLEQADDRPAEKQKVAA